MSACSFRNGTTAKDEMVAGLREELEPLLQTAFCSA